MKTLALLLQLIDQILTAIKLRKAQNERNELEADPNNWFAKHFGNGMPTSKDKTDKTDTGNNA